MIYYIFGAILLAIFLFVVWTLCATAAAADKAEEYNSDNL